jgi:hypothetical protein
MLSFHSCWMMRISNIRLYAGHVISLHNNEACMLHLQFMFSTPSVSQTCTACAEIVKQIFTCQFFFLSSYGNITVTQELYTDTFPDVLSLCGVYQNILYILIRKNIPFFTLCKFSNESRKIRLQHLHLLNTRKQILKCLKF